MTPLELYTEALRENRFTQVETVLCIRTKPEPWSYSWTPSWAYCALGVACELYRAQTGIGTWVPMESQALDPLPAGCHGFRISPDSQTLVASLPDAVREWLNLGFPPSKLVEANDDFRWDFQRIATEIANRTLLKSLDKERGK